MNTPANQNPDLPDGISIEVRANHWYARGATSPMSDNYDIRLAGLAGYIAGATQQQSYNEDVIAGLHKRLNAATAEIASQKERIDELTPLLNQVADCFTRYDDLPDNLVWRVDRALGRNAGSAGHVLVSKTQ